MALRDDADDVLRLFEVLVQTLADTSPERLHGPIQVSEVYQTILPYRRFRTALGFDTNQDYETALLRFLSGEGAFVTLHPPEAQDSLAAEAQAVHPDPGLVREFAGATIRIERARLQQVLADEQRFAPSGADAEMEQAPAGENPAEAVQRAMRALEPEPPPPAAPATTPLEAPVCRNCGRSLPLHRDVVYCPFCGNLAGTRHCVACDEPLEEGWRFCARCGTPSPAPSNRPPRGP